jgi:hypothetical protein
MSWDIFEKNVEAFNELKQHERETGAMSLLQNAVKDGRGIREAVTYALGVGIADDNNWLTIVETVRNKPTIALEMEADSKFFPKCPKFLLEDLVAGEKGLFAQLVNRVSAKSGNPDEANGTLDNGDFRMMHLVIDSLHTLGQNDRLKKVAKLFQDMCDLKSDGHLPGGITKKLLSMKAIEPPSQVNSNPQNAAPRPIRRMEERENLTGAKHVDTHSAKPTNGCLPDNGLAAKLKAATSNISLAS